MGTVPIAAIGTVPITFWKFPLLFSTMFFIELTNRVGATLAVAQPM